MRCGRCGKNFDEEMHSGICPKCGHFNNRQTEYDVSKYFSAKFDDDGKTSTNAQAAKQHEQLHRMYDGHDMHKSGNRQHEQLHKKYDNGNVHRQVSSAPAHQQAGSYQSGGSLGKVNPYQPADMQSGTYPVRQPGSVPGQSYPQQAQYGQKTKLNDVPEKRNLVTPICLFIAIAAILTTVVLVQKKKESLMEIYGTLDYEDEYVEPGELFEIDGRLLMATKAEVIDTSEWPDMAAGEKLVAVSVEVLPTEDWERSDMSGTVYVWDGYTCKQYLDSYVLDEYLDVEDLLAGYDYLSYGSADGLTGRFYFFVDDEAEEIIICFDEDKEEETVFVLERRVNVPLELEGGSYE